VSITLIALRRKERLRAAERVVHRAEHLDRGLHLVRVKRGQNGRALAGEGRVAAPDQTTPVMRANGLPDASENAQHSYNTQYMSSNFYQRAPKKGPGGVPGYSNLDHVYVTPGIAVQKFGVGLILSHGKFVGAIPSDHNPVWATLFLQN